MNKKTFWILILIGMIMLLFFVVISNVLDVGVRLRTIHVYLEYAFYGTAGLLLYVLILHPLQRIFFAPTFKIDALASDKKNAKAYRNAARTLLRMENVSETEKTLLRTNINEDVELQASLKTVFNGSVRNNVDKIIVKHAKTVLMTTAISQNGSLDMFSVIVTNIRMIRAIVEECGFRPSYTSLAKLSLNVGITAMIAEGLEDVNFNEMLPSKFGEAMADLPMVRTATSSIFQGISNGLLTCRIGIVTRKYLFQDNEIMSQKQLRLASYKESFRLMPVVIAEGLVAFPKGIVNVALRPFKRAKKEGSEG